MSSISDQQLSCALNVVQQQPTAVVKTNPPSEFMRRKNWSQSILDELRDVMHVLSSNFKIIYCSPACSEFLGYQTSELVSHLYTEYIHLDDVDFFSRQFRSSKDTMQPLNVYYRFLHKDGRYITLEVNGHFYNQCFFGAARAIPTNGTRTMDMFLDLKMENEALKQKLFALKAEKGSERREGVADQSEEEEEKREEEEEEEEEIPGTDVQTTAPHVYSAGAATSYDVSESVSLFTGLNYTMGERSRGISMGLEGELLNVSPAAGQPLSLSSVVVPVDPVTTAAVAESAEAPQKKTKKVYFLLRATSRQFYVP